MCFKTTAITRLSVSIFLFAYCVVNLWPVTILLQYVSILLLTTCSTRTLTVCLKLLSPQNLCCFAMALQGHS